MIYIVALTARAAATAQNADRLSLSPDLKARKLQGKRPSHIRHPRKARRADSEPTPEADQKPGPKAEVKKGRKTHGA
jgi:hypothetical protein